MSIFPRPNAYMWGCSHAHMENSIFGYKSFIYLSNDPLVFAEGKPIVMEYPKDPLDGFILNFHIGIINTPPIIQGKFPCRC